MNQLPHAESLEPRLHLSAGDLNSGDLKGAFGNGGIVTQNFGGDISAPQIAVDSTGKIFASMSFTPKNSKKPELLLARFTSLGRLDTSFGHGGDVVLTGTVDQAAPSKPLIDSHGRILVCFDGNLFRFTSSGAADASFGVGGSVKNLGAMDVAIASDGKLVVTCGNNVERLLSNGSVDRSFANRGKYNMGNTGFGSEPDEFEAYDPHIAPDGSVYLLYRAGDFDSALEIISGVMRLTPSGKLDRSFNGGAVGSSAFQESGLALASVLTPAGNIAISNTCDDGGTVITEFDSQGQPVKGFGPDGVAVVYNGGLADASLLQDTDGNLVCTAVIGDAYALDAIRLRANGTFDMSFQGGEAVQPFGSFNDDIRAALMPNHDIVLAMPTTESGNSSSTQVGLRLVEIQGRTTDADSVPATISSTGALTIRGGTGNDSIEVDQDSLDNPVDQFIYVTVNKESFSFYQPGVKSILIDAGAGNDSILNDAPISAVTILGGAGSDRIDSEQDAGILNGGLGNDTLITAGRATLIGGAGEDLADFSRWTAPLKITLDNKANDGSAATGSIDVESDIEDVIGGSANDLITGNPSFNHLYGGPGNDTLWGGGGNDTLEGGHGHDQLFGQDGNDLLIARDQTQDTLDGGDGIDRASADASALVKDVLFNIEIDV